MMLSCKFEDSLKHFRLIKLKILLQSMLHKYKQSKLKFQILNESFDSDCDTKPFLASFNNTLYNDYNRSLIESTSSNQENENVMKLLDEINLSMLPSQTQKVKGKSSSSTNLNNKIKSSKHKSNSIQTIEASKLSKSKSKTELNKSNINCDFLNYPNLISANGKKNSDSSHNIDDKKAKEHLKTNQFSVARFTESKVASNAKKKSVLSPTIIEISQSSSKKLDKPMEIDDLDEVTEKLINKADHWRNLKLNKTAFKLNYLSKCRSQRRLINAPVFNGTEKFQLNWAIQSWRLFISNQKHHKCLEQTAILFQLQKIFKHMIRNSKTFK